MRVIAAALAYRREHGLALIPLEPRGKRPHFEVLDAVYSTSKTDRLRNRASSEAEIESWFAVDPSCNVGIVTGQASGGLVVLDVDRPDLELPLGCTPTALTTRGRHHYVVSDSVSATAAEKFGEIRAGGAYVVAPPSIHPTGTAYLWRPGQGLGDVELGVCTPEEIHALLEFLRSGPSHGTGKEGYLLAETILVEAPSLRNLAAWDSYEPFVLAAAAFLGIPSRVGEKFRCVLPGHEERHPSACLWRDSRGLVVYRDFHAAKRKRPGRKALEALTLTEVYAAKVSGEVRRLAAPEHARWKLRLLVKTGLVAPAVVDEVKAPSNLCEPAVTVYDGFIELLGLRWLTEPHGTPAPFSWRFASRWCGVSAYAAEKAMKELLERGLIRPVGAVTGQFGKQMTLFAPGDGRPRERDVGRLQDEKSRFFEPWGRRRSRKADGQ